MTKLWPGGQAITVETDAAGLPSRFRWKGQTYQVEKVAAEWIRDEQWWKARIYRQYYKLRTAELLVEVFQNLLTGEWFLETQYD